MSRVLPSLHGIKRIVLENNKCLGKDWVEGIQESRASLLDYEEERKKRVAMLKEKEVVFCKTNRPSPCHVGTH